MKKMTLFLIIVFLLPLGACKKEQPVVKKPMAEKINPVETKTDITKESEEVSAVTKEEYIYDSKARRDPFMSLVVIAKQKPLKKKGATPIESFSIDEIKLLAIAWDKSKHYALIMLPDKKTFTITEGMTLGLEGGKVEKITENEVIIREFVKDYRGNIKPKDTILKLHKGEEG
jgi:Tfp pilus assembly protein PilP